MPSGYTLTGDPDVPAPPACSGGLCDGQHTVTLINNQEYVDADFGYQPGGTGEIGDLVWWDEDRNGNDNGGTEQGIPDVTVYLYEDTNNDGIIDPAEDLLVATTQTDSNGEYSFTGLPGDVDFLVLVDKFDPDLVTFFKLK